MCELLHLFIWNKDRQQEANAKLPVNLDEWKDHLTKRTLPIFGYDKDDIQSLVNQLNEQDVERALHGETIEYRFTADNIIAQLTTSDIDHVVMPPQLRLCKH